MKTKQRFTKIMSWWLIISMVMQMLPFSVISAFAEGPVVNTTTETKGNVSQEETSEGGSAISSVIDDDSVNIPVTFEEKGTQLVKS